MKSGSISRVLPALGFVPALMAFAYAGWTLYSRSRENQRLEQIDEAKQAENNRRFLELYGSESLKILSFYASPGQIRHGSKALLCYGVLNARSVELDPPVEPVHPAVSYCFSVTPAKTTTYTLTADGRSGGRAAQAVTIVVR